MVAAVADGLGSLEQSQDGASSVVSAITSILLSKDVFERLYAGQVGEKEVISECQSAIIEAVGESCYGKAACTLLFVAICKGRCVTGQIGDGAIFEVREDGYVRIGSRERGLPDGATRTVIDRDAVERIDLHRWQLDKCRGFILTTDGLRGVLYYPNSDAPAGGIMHPYALVSYACSRDGSRYLSEYLSEISSEKNYDDLGCAVISFGGPPPDYQFDPSWRCCCGNRNAYDSLYCSCGMYYDSIYSFEKLATVTDRILFLSSLNEAFRRYPSDEVDAVSYIQSTVKGVEIVDNTRFTEFLSGLMGKSISRKKKTYLRSALPPFRFRTHGRGMSRRRAE